MVNRFLRTASTRRLLSVIVGTVAVIAAGTTIAIAAGGSGPVPPPKPLAQAIHAALAAPKVQGISASIKFTNRLIGTSEIQGTDPLLSGGSGRVWLSSDHSVRLELQGDNGDANVVITKSSWWAYDPASNTVYEGTVPAKSGAPKRSSKPDKLPSVAQIQTQLQKLMQHLGITGAVPSDVAGQPAYTVTVSPKSSGGLIGAAQLAWDALKGVPLRFAVYARGDNAPVLELAATGITYGPVSSDVFSISPPAGAKVVKVSAPSSNGAADKIHGADGSHTKSHGTRGQHAEVTGTSAVAGHLKFTLAAPRTLAGMSRQSVRLLEMGGKSGALVTYGKGLGGIAVLEQPATASSARQLQLSQGSGDHAHGLSLPTKSINGITAQELDTALGTVVRFTRSGVTFTVLGSVKPAVADAAARSL
jgi:outer membrane lipoprotein-sorting protein